MPLGRPKSTALLQMAALPNLVAMRVIDRGHQTEAIRTINEDGGRFHLNHDHST